MDLHLPAMPGVWQNALLENPSFPASLQAGNPARSRRMRKEVSPSSPSPVASGDAWLSSLLPGVGRERRAVPGRDRGLQGFAGMLRNLGLDRVPPGSSADLRYVRAQFEINYQALRAVRTANGLEVSQESFSFKLDLAYLQAGTGEALPELRAEGAEAAAGDPLQALKDFLSPEKTAQRILDFALSFFPRSRQFRERGDTPDARRAFADFMGEAIDRGFSAARAILGELPDEVEAQVQDTHERVFAGLDDFVAKGLDPDKTGPGGDYERIQAFQLQISMEYTRMDSSLRFVPSSRQLDTVV